MYWSVCDEGLDTVCRVDLYLAACLVSSVKTRVSFAFCSIRKLGYGSVSFPLIKVFDHFQALICDVKCSCTCTKDGIHARHMLRTHHQREEVGITKVIGIHPLGTCMSVVETFPFSHPKMVHLNSLCCTLKLPTQSLFLLKFNLSLQVMYLFHNSAAFQQCANINKAM